MTENRLPCRQSIPDDVNWEVMSCLMYFNYCDPENEVIGAQGQSSCEQTWVNRANLFFRRQEILVAFISGVLAALLCRQLIRSLDRQQADENWDYPFKDNYPNFPRPEVCNWTYVPPGLALNPQLLQKALANLTIVPNNLIVVARHSEDTSWLDVYLNEFPHIIYEEDRFEDSQGAQYLTIANKGNEAMAYLQFIIDFYDQLPQNVLFIHGNRHAWHLQDHVPVIRRLKWGAFPFANLRYSPGERLQWSCGRRSRDAWREMSCSWVGLKIRPRGMSPRTQNMISIRNADEWQDSTELHSVWPQLFQEELGDPPQLLYAPCCAEFMVSKERILLHPRSFYTTLRDWIDEVEIDSYRCGRQFEYMWHYIFGEPAVMEPKFECDLLHCDSEQLKEAKFWLNAAAANVSTAFAEFMHWN
eukprot:jgi/Botrbrau1/17477/Bobra.0054s0064.1